MILKSPFVEKRRMQPLCQFLFVFCLYTVLQNSSKSSNFLVFHSSKRILSRPASFLFLIFFSTILSYSWVNYSSLMSTWLFIVFIIGLSETLGNFPNRFLKCNFRIYMSSSWLAAFSLVLKTFFCFCLPYYLWLSIFYRGSHLIWL